MNMILPGTPAYEARKALLSKHVEELLASRGQAGWKLVFTREAHRAGATYYQRRELHLSLLYCMAVSEEAALNVARHEVAHILAGKEAGHGKVWRALCLALGGDGKRMTSETSKITYSVNDALWLGTCPTCGHMSAAHRAPQVVYACTICCKDRIFRLEHAFLWKKRGVTVPHEQVSAKYWANYQLIKARG